MTDTCKNGHSEWGRYRSGARFCRTCDRVTRRALYRRTHPLICEDCGGARPYKSVFCKPCAIKRRLESARRRNPANHKRHILTQKHKNTTRARLDRTRDQRLAEMRERYRRNFVPKVQQCQMTLCARTFTGRGHFCLPHRISNNKDRSKYREALKWKRLLRAS